MVGLWLIVLFMVDSLLFMEDSDETIGTAISQSVGRSQGIALRNQLRTEN